MIVTLESLRMAFASLRHNPLRAVLTILGIVIGVAAVVALTAIGSGSTRAVENRFNAFGTDTVTVESSNFSSGSVSLDSADVTAIDALSSVKQTVSVVSTNASVTLGSTSTNASVMGTSPQIVAIDHLSIEAGTFFSAFDASHALHVAVLGNTVASDLGLSAYDAVGKTIDIGGVQFRVIGVLVAQGGVGFASVDSSVIAPLGSIEGSLVAFRPGISQIRVQAYPAAVDNFQSAIESTLRTTHDLTSSEYQADFQIVNASSIASAVSSSTKTLTRLMAAIAAISLVVGGIGVANVMLVTVRERTREVGVRRAVGARRRDIIAQFLVYAIVISVVGGLLGLGVGIGAAYVGGSYLSSVSPVFSPTTVALALVVAAAVGILAGIGPALQASSVEPTEALRYE